MQFEIERETDGLGNSRRLHKTFEVPSAILPDTYNLPLNPLHPNAQRVRVLSHETYAYDRSRLFKSRR